MFDADQLKQFAKSTLKSAATDEDKAAAKKAVRRINAYTEIAKGRPKRPKRKDYDSDEAHNKALFEFRSLLDKAAVVREASKILDDPNSSVYLRRKARETLYGPDPEPAESVKTTESQVPEKPSRSRLGANELAEEQARAQTFLDSIGQPDVQPHVDVPAPAVQEHVPPKPSPQPERWCPVHAVSLDVCRCDVHETCELCLCPRSRCYFPCQNAGPRR
jgi:hypothetical protein